MLLRFYRPVLDFTVVCTLHTKYCVRMRNKKFKIVELFIYLQAYTEKNHLLLAEFPQNHLLEKI